MRFEDQSLLRMEEFFRRHLGMAEISFGDIRVHSNCIISAVGRVLGFDGLTFRRHVFVASRAFTRGPEGVLSLAGAFVAHEAMHVLQYRERGTFAFLREYTNAYISGLKSARTPLKVRLMAAYHAIPYEMEARKVEDLYKSFFAVEQAKLAC